MIICIDCVEHSVAAKERFDRNNDLYPFGDCSACGQYAPLTEGHRKSEPGKFYDTLGNEIKVGDRIAYSVAAGRSSGKMIIGRIYKFGARTVNVEFETIYYQSGDYNKMTRFVEKTYFNYHPSKCLKLDS